MMWLLTRPIVWPLRASAYSAQAGYRTGKLVGYRRLLYLAIGVVIGLLLAPTTGAELREKVRARMSRGPMGALPPAGGTTTSVEPDLDLTEARP
jgi:hypothetical protein